MPDAWTHILGAKDVLNRIDNNEYKRIIEKNIKIFNLAAQGPDLFTYYLTLFPNRRKKLKNLGELLHTSKTGDFIIYNIKWAKGKKEDESFNIIFTYLMGFITHYALDISIHPYIYYFGGVYNKERSHTKKYDVYHKRLETNIGSINLFREMGLNAYETPIYEEILFHKKIIDAIQQFYYNGIHNIYDIDIGKDLILYCYNGMGKMFKLVVDPSKKKYKLLYKLQKIIKKPLKLTASIYNDENKNIDYLNMKHRKWVHPCDKNEVHNESVDELYVNGVNMATNMLNRAIEFINGERNSKSLKGVFPNLSYESGKEIAKEKKMIYYDCIFDNNEE
ncbi:zinc dependent phospholipase C family protein [Clostridium rectalis]|uniref:zinc dependent phospholipase C family protein n=1 Tax=Clostridium rectalis TaxID=2040295 RepID=UPI000F638980|nr:zinc dependent phospholipase C family protein [Clostridium rectalis]